MKGLDRGWGGPGLYSNDEGRDWIEGNLQRDEGSLVKRNPARGGRRTPLGRKLLRLGPVGSGGVWPFANGFATSTIAVWAGAATVFMAVSRAHNHSALLVKIGAMGLAGLTAIVYLATTSSRWRPEDLWRHWIPKMVGFILLMAVIGGPFALFPGKAFEVLTQAYSRTILIGVIAFAIARTPAGARFMARVVASAGLGAIFLALHVNGFNTAGRLEGAYTYDANDLALIAILTLPLVIWWITDRTSRLGKLLIPTVPLILWVIYRTDSRGGFLGLAAVSIGFLMFSFRWAPPKMKKVGRLVLLGLVLAAPFAGGKYSERMRSIADEDDYNRTAPAGRIQVWKRGLGYAFSNPILGVGLGNFNTAEGWSSEARQRGAVGIGWKWSTAHNSYLQVAAELGLLAGAVFLILIVRTTLTLTLWFRNRERARGPPNLLPPFLGLSFLGYAVCGFFLSFAYYDVLYVLLGLASAIMLTDEFDRKRRGTGPQHPARPGRIPHRAVRSRSSSGGMVGSGMAS